MEFTEHTVVTAHGPRLILVGTPTTASIVDADGVEALRQRPSTALQSSTDTLILKAVQERARKVRVFVFRGANSSGDTVWSISSDLPETERAEAGCLFTRTHLPMFRKLLHAGVMAIIHCDLEADTVAALQDGTQQLLLEMVGSGGGTGPGTRSTGGTSREIDTWILRNFTFYFLLSSERVLEQLLPEKLPMLEKRMPRVLRMLESLPTPPTE